MNNRGVTELRITSFCRANIRFTFCEEVTYIYTEACGAPQGSGISSL